MSLHTIILAPDLKGEEGEGLSHALWCHHPSIQVECDSPPRILQGHLQWCQWRATDIMMISAALHGMLQNVYCSQGRIMHFYCLLKVMQQSMTTQIQHTQGSWPWNLLCWKLDLFKWPTHIHESVEEYPSSIVKSMSSKYLQTSVPVEFIMQKTCSSDDEPRCSVGHDALFLHELYLVILLGSTMNIDSL